jgi:hypothetical protein
MKTTNLAKIELFYELSRSEMMAVEGGFVRSFADAINTVVTGVVGFLTGILLAHPYCVAPMTMGKPCI